MNKSKYNGKCPKEKKLANVQKKIQWQFKKLPIKKSIKNNR